jgi:hypothetical protein
LRGASDADEVVSDHAEPNPALHLVVPLVSTAGDKPAAFQRLANSRTNQALDIIRKIENLSNRGNYEYPDEEVAEIFKAIEEALDGAEGRFITDTAIRRTFRLSASDEKPSSRRDQVSRTTRTQR